MNLEEHLNRFTSGGTYDSEGSFTLDRQKALEKLGNFSLEQWVDVLFLLGAWLTRDGEDPVDFEVSPRRLTVRRAATRLTPERISHLEDYLLVSGTDHGVSMLALARHVWPADGTFSIGCEGLKRKWERGKSREEGWGLQKGVEIELTHSKISGQTDRTAEFLARHLSWTPFSWTLNGLSITTPPPPPKSLMALNHPRLPQIAMAGVTLDDLEFDFQLYAQWGGRGSSVVVVEGIAYPLDHHVLPGLRTVVFCNKTQRNITRTDVVVSEAQRESWKKAVLELIKAFAAKPHFWNNKEFLHSHGPVFCRAMWSDFDHPPCFSALQRAAAVLSKESFTPLILARAAIRRGDHLGALYHLRPLRKSLSREDASYAQDVDTEFFETYPALSLTAQELHELKNELGVCEELGRLFPQAVFAFCFNLAAAAEGLGLSPIAERLYLSAYFLPRGLEPGWSSLLQVHSYLDIARNKAPEWLAKMDNNMFGVEAIWAVIDLAQRCQSSQVGTLTQMKDRFFWNRDPRFVPELNLRRLESWRLERKTAQAEWFKWHLVAKLQGYQPRYPPRSHDQSYEIPNYFLAEGIREKLMLLRCRTAYLEYAALSARLAESHQQIDQLVRYEAVLKTAHEVFDNYRESDHPEELVELARVAIELGRTGEAADMLRRAVCKYPVGDFHRLPLLVDMAILEPHRADSVLNGLFRVLNLEDTFAGSFDQMVAGCTWPFPFELPSRLKRLAWELSPVQALKVYRLARVLYRKAFGPNWLEPTEQDWVGDAIELLKRR